VTQVAAGDPRVVLDELASVFDRIDQRDLERLADTVLDTDRTFAAGQGRSGLVAAAFAVRLGHLGKETHVVGEATAPAVGPGDLVVALSRSGTRPLTLHQVERALGAGAQVAALCADAQAPLMRAASVAVVLPVHDVQTRQHAGSLFEQAALILLDSLCWRLQATLGRTDAELAARHDNLQ
jgi:6-phospho-3-hexuloisomerase